MYIGERKFSIVRDALRIMLNQPLNINQRSIAEAAVRRYCNQEVKVIAGEGGYVNTPGYPLYYLGGSTCGWTFRTLPGQRIVLTFHDLNIRGKLDVPQRSVRRRDDLTRRVRVTIKVDESLIARITCVNQLCVFVALCTKGENYGRQSNRHVFFAPERKRPIFSRRDSILIFNLAQYRWWH